MQLLIMNLQEKREIAYKIMNGEFLHNVGDLYPLIYNIAYNIAYRKVSANQRREFSKLQSTDVRKLGYVPEILHATILQIIK
jgi:hypothetical protein